MADLSLVFDLLARDRASSEVAKVSKSFDEAGNHAEGLGEKLNGVWDLAKGTAVGAGLAVGAAFFGAIDQQTANTKLAGQLGLNPKESAQAGQIAGSLYAQNYGDSLESVNDAVKAVRQNIGIQLGSADFAPITAKVEDLASAFDVDVGDSTKAVAQLMRTGLAPNAKAALDIVTAGLQNGNNASGDWIDTLNEYSVQFKKLGIGGQQATELISQGMKAGARDSDLVADAIKEFSIRAVDGSKTTAAGFKAIGLNAGTMAGAIGKGGTTANKALQTTLDHLKAIPDPVKRSQAAVNLFGTQAEDLGSALYALNPATAQAAAGADKIKGASDRLDATLSSGVGPALEKMKRGAQLAATQGMGALINGFTQGKTHAGGWQGAVQNLSATVSGVLWPAFKAVAGFVTGTVLPALSAVFGFLASHSTTVSIVAGVIALVLVPALIAWGVQSLIAAARSGAGWVASTAQASWGAVQQVGSAVRVVASWALMAGQAVANGVRIAAVWTAQVVASAVRGAASMAVQVARVVGGWVLMGIQSLIQAARMAAAWFIALGPVGWVIAAVIGIVILIIANWKRVVAWTTTAWHAVTGAITGAWHAVIGAITTAWAWIQGKVSAAWAWVKSITGTAWGAVAGAIRGAWNKITGWISGAWTTIRTAVSNGISKAIDLVKGLPGKIWNVLKGADKWLYDTGKNIITGLINGAGSLLKNIGRMFLKIVPGFIRGPFESALGIGSPSTVFAEYGRNVGQGLINGLTGMRSAIGGTVGGLLDGGGGLGFTVPRYDLGGAGAGGRGAATYVTTVSGVASPEAVAAQVVRAQRTNEFLAGVGT